MASQTQTGRMDGQNLASRWNPIWNYAKVFQLPKYSFESSIFRRFIGMLTTDYRTVLKNSDIKEVI